MLRRHGCNGVWRGEVSPLEVRRCKVGDAVSDGGGELRDGLLNLDGVVVGFGLVCFGDPAGTELDVNGCASLDGLT